MDEETRFLGAQGRPTFDTVFKAYADGDYDVLSRAIQTRQDLLVVQQDALRAAKDDKRPWTPALPTFLLELAVDAQAHDWWDFQPLLAAVRTVAVARPSAPGMSADGDRFEITLHRAAVAFMTAANMEEPARAYLDALRARVVPAELPGAARLVDPRVTLARASIDEAEIDVVYWPTFTAAAPCAVPRDQAMRKRITDAVAAFDDAAAIPTVSGEARTHEGLLLCQLGEPGKALDALDQSGTTDDRTVQYWRALFRGRVLVALNRLDEAEAAYRLASTIYPAAQTPAVALVPLLLKQNRMDEVLDWSSAARKRGSAAVDPWWQYRDGDLRFFPVWIRELRAAWGRAS